MTVFRDYKIIADNKTIGRVNVCWDSSFNYTAEVLLNGPICMELVNETGKQKNRNIQKNNITAKTKDDLFKKVDEHMKSVLPNIIYEYKNI
jgi:hypothetical protein